MDLILEVASSHGRGDLFIPSVTRDCDSAPKAEWSPTDSEDRSESFFGDEGSVFETEDFVTSTSPRAPRGIAPQCILGQGGSSVDPVNLSPLKFYPSPRDKEKKRKKRILVRASDLGISCHSTAGHPGPKGVSGIDVEETFRQLKSETMASRRRLSKTTRGRREDKSPHKRRPSDRKSPTKRRSSDRKSPTERRSSDRKSPTERRSSDRKSPTERRSSDRKSPTERRISGRKSPSERRRSERKSPIERRLNGCEDPFERHTIESKFSSLKSARRSSRRGSEGQDSLSKSCHPRVGETSETRSSMKSRGLRTSSPRIIIDTPDERRRRSHTRSHSSEHNPSTRGREPAVRVKSMPRDRSRSRPRCPGSLLGSLNGNGDGSSSISEDDASLDSSKADDDDIGFVVKSTGAGQRRGAPRSSSWDSPAQSMPTSSSPSNSGENSLVKKKENRSKGPSASQDSSFLDRKITTRLDAKMRAFAAMRTVMLQTSLFQGMLVRLLTLFLGLQRLKLHLLIRRSNSKY